MVKPVERLIVIKPRLRARMPGIVEKKPVVPVPGVVMQRKAGRKDDPGQP